MWSRPAVVSQWPFPDPLWGSLVFSTGNLYIILYQVNLNIWNSFIVLEQCCIRLLCDVSQFTMLIKPFTSLFRNPLLSDNGLIVFSQKIGLVDSNTKLLWTRQNRLFCVIVSWLFVKYFHPILCY